MTTTTTTANSTADTTADDTSPTSDTTGEPPDPDAPLSEHIVVDQFGYRPNAEKLAVLRSAVTGFDAGTTYTPGASYAVVDAFTNEVVLEVAPAQWNGGADDPSSGDVAWRVDFSAVTEPGDYYVLDTDAQVRSDLFRIADDVYADVLAQSLRAGSIDIEVLGSNTGQEIVECLSHLDLSERCLGIQVGT